MWPLRLWLKHLGFPVRNLAFCLSDLRKVRLIFCSDLRHRLWAIHRLKNRTRIARHLEGILAHWRKKTTNAFLEALSSVLSVVKRK